MTKRKKTSDKTVRLIRQYYKTKQFTLRQLAEMFDLSESGISRIVNQNRRKEKNNERY